MSLNTTVADTIQENIIMDNSEQIYPHDTFLNQQNNSHVVQNDTSSISFIQGATPSYESSSTVSISSIVCQEHHSEQVSEISNSVNKILSDIVYKSITTTDSQGSATRCVQSSSPSSSQNIDNESENNKENESVNGGILVNIQNQQCTPQSPCLVSSPSRILKRSQSNTSSTSKGNSKNDENENMTYKGKTSKNSPQNPSSIVLNSTISNHSTLQNKQSNSQNTQFAGSNIQSSPFRERDQNKNISSAQPPNSVSVNSGSRHNSSEKLANQITTNQTQQTPNLINCNVNEPLIIQQDQLFEQKESCESIVISNLPNSDDSQEEVQTYSDDEKQQYVNSVSQLNNQQEENGQNVLKQQDEEVQEGNNLSEIQNQSDIQLKEEVQLIEFVEKQISEIDFSNCSQSEKTDQSEINQENEKQEQEEDEKEKILSLIVNNLIQQTIEEQQEILQEEKEEDGEYQKQQDEQITGLNEREQTVVTSKDANMILPISVIGAEEDEYEQEQQYKENTQFIDQNDKENYENSIENKENYDAYQEQNAQIEESNDVREDEEEEQEKSVTIQHLESYQSIIRETDSYLDQLVMYMLKEKNSLTAIQKSIQGKRSTRTTSLPEQPQQSVKEYSQESSNQNRNEDIKQKKQQQQDEDYKYQSQREQKEEEKVRKSNSSSTSSHQVAAQKQNQQQQQQNQQQTQHPSKGYNHYQQQYQQVVTRNQPAYSHVSEILQLSIDSIKFGIVFPGNIFEEQAQIANKTNETVFIKVVGLCLNPEFDNHGEYVYSIRKTINYDYNEKLMFSIPPYSSIKVHIALKVPNINQQKIIKGSLAVTVNGYDSYISVPITCSVEIPKILCTRQLFQASRSSKVIKLAIRRGKKNDCKIPFKNTYGYALQLEPFWLTDQTNDPHITNMKDGSQCPFVLSLTPQLIQAQAKNLFMINLLLRPNQYYKEYNEKRILTGDKTPLHIKNVLIIKIANSSLLLHFPVSLEVY